MIPLRASNAAVVVMADQPQLRERLRESLESNGFQVTEAPDCGNQSLTACFGSDLFLPDRASNSLLLGDDKPLAVMIVSGVSDTDSVENLAHIESRMDRAKQFRWGPLSIDFDDRRVVVAGRQVLLTHIEHSLLCILAEKAGKLVPTRQIIRKLWGCVTSSRLKCLRVHACSLRRKLSNPLLSKLILTDPGLGYRLASLEPLA
jgi:DNA-binding response OmpR family regulator